MSLRRLFEFWLIEKGEGRERERGGGGEESLIENHRHNLAVSSWPDFPFVAIHVQSPAPVLSIFRKFSLPLPLCFLPLSLPLYFVQMLEFFIAVQKDIQTSKYTEKNVSWLGRMFIRESNLFCSPSHNFTAFEQLARILAEFHSVRV